MGKPIPKIWYFCKESMWGWMKNDATSSMVLTHLIAMCPSYIQSLPSFVSTASIHFHPTTYNSPCFLAKTPKTHHVPSFFI